MKLLGIVLIILGVLALAYGGFSYISNDKVAEVGPVQVRADREHVVWIPPVAGGIAVIAGVLLVLSGRRAAVV